MAAEYPMNRVAPVVVALVLLIAAVEIVLSAGAMGLAGGQGGIGWRSAAVGDWGFSPAVWEQIVARGNWSVDMLKRLVTYGLVHGSFTHALFAAVLMLALGKFVGDIFHPLAVLAVVVAGLVAGAAAFGTFVSGARPLIGAYPGVYALIGAFTYVLWLRLGRQGRNQIAAFRLIGMLMALQLVFGLVFGSDPAWIAEVAGFLAGFALSVLVSPGGLAALRQRMRSR